MLLEQNVIEQNVEIALISEQYNNLNCGEGLANISKKTAIRSYGNQRL